MTSQVKRVFRSNGTPTTQLAQYFTGNIVYLENLSRDVSRLTLKNYFTNTVKPVNNDQP